MPLPGRRGWRSTTADGRSPVRDRTFVRPAVALYRVMHRSGPWVRDSGSTDLTSRGAALKIMSGRAAHRDKRSGGWPTIIDSGARHLFPCRVEHLARTVQIGGTFRIASRPIAVTVVAAGFHVGGDGPSFRSPPDAAPPAERDLEPTDRAAAVSVGIRARVERGVSGHRLGFPSPTPARDDARTLTGDGPRRLRRTRLPGQSAVPSGDHPLPEQDAGRTGDRR